MNQIDQLVTRFSPNGVELVALKDVIAYEQPTRYIVKSTEYDDAFPIPVLTAGQTFVLGKTNEENGIYSASKDNPVVIFDDFTTAKKWVDFKFKVKSSAMKILTSRDSERADLRYVYFAMQTIRYHPRDHARQWIGIYSNFQIPLPPLEVQREIVRILDKFTALEAELAAELEARQKQYAHYRAKLLTPTSSASQRLLGDVATIGTGKHDTKDAVDDGQYTFYARGRQPLTLNSYDFDEEAVITAGDGVGVGKVFHFANGKYALHQRAYRIVPGPEIDGRYLYHSLVEGFSTYLTHTSHHASVTSLRRPMFLKYPLMVPPLQAQREISAELDMFDRLVNDISSGIPAEIVARRRQYEYYRDRLLTFKDLAA